MRVLGIDARGIDAGVGAGIAHATRELINVMEQEASAYGFTLAAYRARMNGGELARAVSRDGISHMFVPSGAVSPFLRTATYPWVHDLAIFEHPEWFPQGFGKRFLTTRMYLSGLRRANHVFAVSQDTKNAVMRIAGLSDARITVTHQGVHVDVAGWRRDTANPYVLAIGTVEPRKNLSLIDTIWPQVIETAPGARFLVAGRNGWGKVPLKNAERIEIFDDARRDELLRGASALALPSLHEGFGRTVLEAMSIGVPVISSNRGALPEIVGSAGILIDPQDGECWKQAIIQALRGELDGQKGLIQSHQFSWLKTAHTILAKIAETW